MRLLLVEDDRMIGRSVEQGRPQTLFQAAAHPYTRALLDAVPRAEPGAARVRRGPAPMSAASQLGTAAAAAAGAGCSFADRCPYVHDRCHAEAPQLQTLQPGHRAACHHAERLLADAPPALAARRGD